MKTYCVMVNGRNFLLEMDGAAKRYGFYSTKVVTASDEREAELKAVDLVRAEQSLRTAIKNSKDDPPLIYLEEIREISKKEAKGIPTKGHTFYPEDEDQFKGTPNQAL
jgi:hypothetical protein